MVDTVRKGEIEEQGSNGYNEQSKEYDTYRYRYGSSKAADRYTERNVRSSKAADRYTEWNVRKQKDM